MPAKRIKKNRLVGGSKKKRSLPKYILILSVLFLIFIFQYFFLKNKFWSNDNRLTLVIPQKENVLLVSLDPVKGEMVEFLIPNDTEVEVSGNLGKRKIGNVWEIGTQESDYELLEKSVTSYFKTPIIAWSDKNGSSLIDGHITSIIGAIFKTYKTNLTFKDRLSVIAFVRGLDNIDKTVIDFTDTGLIRKSVLSDGSDGYVLSGYNSPKIDSLFTDYYFTQNTPRISIVTTPSLKNVGKNVGKILEVMGGKIVNLDDEQGGDFYCQVSPKADIRSLRISAVFGCNLVDTPEVSNGEIQVQLGNKFVL